MSEEKKAKSGKGLLIIILVLVVVILAGGGAAAWWFLLKPKGDAKAEAHAEEKPKVVHFVHLEPFVTNVQSQDGQTHYVQVTIDLKTDDEKADELIRSVMPEIRSDVLGMLGAQDATSVASDAVRDKLRTGILADVNKVLAGAEPGAEHMVSGVYFTGFVMQ